MTVIEIYNYFYLGYDKTYIYIKPLGHNGLSGVEELKNENVSSENKKV